MSKRAGVVQFRVILGNTRSTVQKQVTLFMKPSALHAPHLDCLG